MKVSEGWINIYLYRIYRYLCLHTFTVTCIRTDMMGRIILAPLLDG